MKILKFGGSSVGTPERMLKVADIISDNERKVVILSAISGTTDRLVEIIKMVKRYRLSETETKILDLKNYYDNFLFELFSDQDYLEKAGKIVDSSFEHLRSAHPETMTGSGEKELMALGEMLSTGIFQVLLELQGAGSVLINSPEYMRIDKDREPDMVYIMENLTRLIEGNTDKELFLTQGYICKNYYGEIDNLERGGSDYSASIIGAALGADEIQIWTDIDGIHNNDPRVISNTQPVSELSYKEAAELAYFGARILHPKCVFPAQMNNIPLRLKNTFEPDREGTLISASSKRDKVKSIAVKDGIIAIRIRSARMLMAYGFLKKIFQVFEDHKTSIDMITTSEVSVSLTIDNSENLESILAELQSFGEVEFDLDQSIICVVGDFMAEETGMAKVVINALEKIPIRMISYGGSMNNISLVVQTHNKKEALEALHREIFKTQAAYV